MEGEASNMGTGTRGAQKREGPQCDSVCFIARGGDEV